MQKIKLGSSSLEVSKICLGTMTFGEQNSEAEAHSQLDYALERGVNFIDTAEMYPVMASAATQGSTERYIGSWLRQSGKRDQVVLASKIAGPNSRMHWIRDGKSNHDALNIRTAVEDSLRRLQTDHIDLYQLHWPSRNLPIFGNNSYDPQQEREAVAIEDTLAVLGKLIDEGKIGHIGVSNESSWGVSEYIKQAEMKGLPRIVSIQNLYNLTARHFETSLLDETCHRDKVGLLAYSPLAFGQLTAKYIDDPQARGRLTIFPPGWSPRYIRPATIEAARQYAELARAHGLTPTQLALAWCYTRWFVASTIIGATSLEQLQHNIDAYDITLSPELVAAVDAIHASITNPGQ
ncbi:MULTISPECIES: aldo/keto reductase [unclassified Janthinobacterium]|uniref:aldo/keto reductase n=1 Tax=unclassified Janthinobacterium TaxID=2610881 RepID=UPI001612A917|nr:MULTISPECIES: aldo/keto reductase [unclassified Janthinobacterium]MBB5367569.1 aryl-alcohol dehydrogenase-like predicted oxidoreductase [Janthinobacterium sp. K2C7]MBB5379953.1 aryl-alcohol dehydrogenase-like predicted oxidoreductase [Janthinobacterium sp. K2Li3]MBB5385951.1 aryl-alcohol dehydrogenase-like predicted oxidoreductase [Janthinobacterium sp. K2E3]